MREYLEAKEGQTWTFADTGRVMEHIRQVEETWKALRDLACDTKST